MANKSYYDMSVQCDVTHFPKYLQEIIEELEEYSLEQNELMYDMNFYVLEAEAKSFLLHGKITEDDFNKLMRKYGWYDE